MPASTSASVLGSQLDPAYVNGTLIPSINTVTLATELGGDTGYISQFSFAGGESGYSFGLYQYDVRSNTGGLAQSFLRTVGFNSSQISGLASNGGLSQSEQDALSAQLEQALQIPVNQNALQQLNDTWAASLVSQLQDTLDLISGNNPPVAEQLYQSTDFQLRLVDYINQFGGISSSGPMARWLSGDAVPMPSGATLQILPGHQLTDADFDTFVMSTAEGCDADSKKAEQDRENALNGAISGMGFGAAY